MKLIEMISTHSGSTPSELAKESSKTAVTSALELSYKSWSAAKLAASNDIVTPPVITVTLIRTSPTYLSHVKLVFEDGAIP